VDETKYIARNEKTVGKKTLFLKPVRCENIEQTQDTKIYVENPFYLKGKTMGQTPNKSTITKFNYNSYSQMYA
jgi:hypothetical protein